MPQLIFLHGFLGCKEDWSEVISHLPEDFQCTAIDLPGHSGMPYSTDILGEVRHYISTHFPQKPHCIGYSMGGRIALHMADLCASTLVFSAHPGLQDVDERAARWESDSNWIEQLRTLAFPDFLERWYAQPVFESLRKKPSLLQKILERRVQQNPQELALVLAQMSLGKQTPLSSENFSAKTCFIFGEDDWKYRAIYARLKYAERDSRFDFWQSRRFRPCACTWPASPATSLKPNFESRSVYPLVKMIGGCGHAAHLENPIECAHTIREVIHAYT